MLKEIPQAPGSAIALILTRSERVYQYGLRMLHKEMTLERDLAGRDDNA